MCNKIKVTYKTINDYKEGYKLIFSAKSYIDVE